MRRLTTLLSRLLHPAVRKQALEDAAAHFERGDGHLLSQYEVARIFEGYAMSEHRGARMDGALSMVKAALEDSNFLLCGIGGEGRDQAQAQVIDNNKALSALSSVEQDAVVYQYRSRPTWLANDEGWLPWTDCSAEAYEDYVKCPLLNNWQYEARKLYTSPIASGKDAWISVDAALPPPETDVLVRVVKDFTGPAFDVAGIFDDVWASAATEKEIDGTVTHWQPLPPAPDAAVAQKGGGNV